MDKVPRYFEIFDEISRIVMVVYLLATTGVNRHLEVLEAMLFKVNDPTRRIMMAALCEVCIRTQIAFIYVNALESDVSWWLELGFQVLSSLVDPDLRGHGLPTVLGKTVLVF